MMRFFPNVRNVLIGALALAVAACSPSGDYGLPRRLDFERSQPNAMPVASGSARLAPAQGEVIGSGPIRVALLLPLSGQGSIAATGRTMANGARLASEFVERTGTPNIHIVVKDTGGDEARARAAAQQAVAEGASLILGPLRAGAVEAAGSVARSANIPLIGFSNTASVAGPGVYLLAVLPEAETMRALGHARSQGRQSAAALVPKNAYGTVMANAFRQAASELGMPVRGVFEFGNEEEARRAIEAIVPLIVSGQIDTLFLPDRATAPSFGILLEAAAVPRQRLTILGSSEWAGDSAISGQGFLEGALFAGIDPAGLATIAPEYAQRFGTAPTQLATLAYTGVLLANTPALSQATPRYGAQVLVSPTGFNGRDGLFRFHHDGRGEYGLAMMAVAAGGNRIADPARLGGITREAPASVSSGGNVIPPVGDSLVRN